MLPYRHDVRLCSHITVECDLGTTVGEYGSSLVDTSDEIRGIMPATDLVGHTPYVGSYSRDGPYVGLSLGLAHGFQLLQLFSPLPLRFVKNQPQTPAHPDRLQCLYQTLQDCTPHC